MALIGYLLFVTAVAAVGAVLGYAQGVGDQANGKRSALRNWLTSERKH